MRFIITGKAGAGKTHLFNKLKDKGFKPALLYTTREKRDEEAEGAEYYFVDEDKFHRMERAGHFIDTFKAENGTWYGYPTHEYNTKEIIILPPSAISKLNVQDMLDGVTVIYLDIPAEIRTSRQLIKDSKEEVARRLLTDLRDFEDFTLYDLRISNADF